MIPPHWRISGGLLLFVVCLGVFPARAVEPLPALAASSEDLTVSGLSSGGFMAAQFHVAHSASVRGVGILAAGPYYCARNSLANAVSSCMSPNFFFPVPAIEELIGEVGKAARARQIDAPENLRRSRVWLFSGGQDQTVKRAVVDATYQFYRHWLPETAIRYERLPDAGHAMITPEVANPLACPVSAFPFMTRCGDFDAPGRLLAHLLGPLRPKAAKATGELMRFDQGEFADNKAGMAPAAYVYIPSGCRQGGCRLHVAWHGCRQQAEALGERYARESGYNRWAESNRLIVLYPQTVKSGANPNACWDWWGYTGKDYHLRPALQIRAVKAMLERLQGQRAGGG
jgi:poly(3-hydroxybutyrate) depolymerase